MFYRIFVYIYHYVSGSGNINTPTHYRYFQLPPGVLNIPTCELKVPTNKLYIAC